MPRPESSVASTPVVQRAPPPPVPTSTQARSPATASAPHAELPLKSKHRGLLRVLGGLFKRKDSDADDTTAPSDSEASQRRTSRCWSHRRSSLPDAPVDVAAVARRERDATSWARPVEDLVPPTGKKATTAQSRNKDTSSKLLCVKGKTPSVNASSDEAAAERSRLEFLFFGGSDADCTFEPDVQSPAAEDDVVHEMEIRPSLQAKMPLFLAVPLGEKMRRSSVLPDPTEYEF